MQPNFANLSFRNSKRELFQKRDERFNRNRKINEKMETEVSSEVVESIEDVDYYKFYSEEERKQLDLSLKMAIPS
jgi:hypothetical protein